MSTVSVSLDPSEISALADQLGRTIDDVQAAAQQSSRATAEWLQARIVKDLVDQTDVSQKVFARRVKRYVRVSGSAQRVFVGLFRPEASQSNLGTLTQVPAGARAGKYFFGKHFFKGAFVATMPSGFVGIFRRSNRGGRRGDPDLKRIDVEHVDLPSAQAIVASHERPALDYFRRDLERRLQGALA